MLYLVLKVFLFLEGMMELIVKCNGVEILLQFLE